MAGSTRVSSDENVPSVIRMWICTDHDRTPAGQAKVSSYVLAFNQDQARALLDKALLAAGLRGYDMWRYRLEEIALNRPQAEVLNDGDY